MAVILMENNVSFVRVSLQSKFVASVSLTFEVILNSSVEDFQSSLTSFLEYFTTDLTTLGDYSVFEGGRGSLGVIPSGMGEHE